MMGEIKLFESFAWQNDCVFETGDPCWPEECECSENMHKNTFNKPVNLLDAINKSSDSSKYEVSVEC